ncbi:hypothetical protein [Actinokineospora sp. HUAS TT18]|uniref:hypothetical protein n=1 Tax=Actinokineospora sp. HUAS TT18 TaxID=3447451 RepID=UPI003F51DBBD
MDDKLLIRTRRALHGAAELLLAGPQYAASADIRLRVTPGGFGTVAAPDVRVDGVDLVAGTRRVPLTGTYAEIAIAAGLRCRGLLDVYQGGIAVAESDPVEVDAEAARVLADAFAMGDRALRAFAPDVEPVLWPEHFDIGITVAEVNYGVSPGDDFLPEPYAYVGPWTPREGGFWNAPFGAARPLSGLDVEAFFREGSVHSGQ